jgi:hypothetical protein
LGAQISIPYPEAILTEIIMVFLSISMQILDITLRQAMTAFFHTLTISSSTITLSFYAFAYATEIASLNTPRKNKITFLVGVVFRSSF